MKCKMKIMVCSLISVIFINITFFVFLTVSENPYLSYLESDVNIYDFIDSQPNVNVYYLNGKGDISVHETKNINEILRKYKVTKLTVWESYFKLFTLSEKNFILNGKIIRDLPDIENNNEDISKIKLFVEKDTVYVFVYSTKDDENSFAVYKNNNALFSEEIMQYKSGDKNYTPLIGWQNDIIQFNLKGKFYVFLLIIEFIVLAYVYANFGKKKNKQRK